MFEHFVHEFSMVAGYIGSLILQHKNNQNSNKTRNRQLIKKLAILIYRMGKVYRNINSILRVTTVYPNISEDEDMKNINEQVHERFVLYLMNNKDMIAQLLIESNEHIKLIDDFGEDVSLDLKLIQNNLSDANKLLVWINEFFVNSVSNDPIPEDSIYPESLYDENVSWKLYHKTFLEKNKKISDLNTQSAELINVEV